MAAYPLINLLFDFIEYPDISISANPNPDYQLLATFGK